VRSAAQVKKDTGTSAKFVVNFFIKSGTQRWGGDWIESIARRANIDEDVVQRAADSLVKDGVVGKQADGETAPGEPEVIIYFTKEV
jgi:hypothetical protein